VDCPVCDHESRLEIEAAAAKPGVDLFEVCDRFRGGGYPLKRAALAKHMASHLRAGQSGDIPPVDVQRAPPLAAVDRSGAKTLERQRAP
jgi:hypothetical protein